MSARRLNAWLRFFCQSAEYDLLLFAGWVFIAAAVVLFVPLRLLQITGGAL
ncbi:hypothetical protein [Stenotrophomonas humi]|uniref:hypothetical protein n=1 Tax=Stenotrophomonas humi TaxID=405444 RepID=UPI000B1A8D57|nr:hypothetical protein [Stenotrophomonas humi]